MTHLDFALSVAEERAGGPVPDGVHGRHLLPVGTVEHPHAIKGATPEGDLPGGNSIDIFVRQTRIRYRTWPKSCLGF